MDPFSLDHIINYSIASYVKEQSSLTNRQPPSRVTFEALGFDTDGPEKS